jgi:hypothetical protein
MSTTVAEPGLMSTAFARLQTEGRQLNPVLKGPTHKPGRFGFRGELALRFAVKLADEARPPEMTCDQVVAVAQSGDPKVAFFAGYLLSFEHLKDVAEALGDTLSAGGKYFLFCNNIDLSKKDQVTMKGAMFCVLPIDEATVYNELLELLYLEKTELKKLDTAGKTDRVVDAALKFDIRFDTITYDEGLTLTQPEREPVRVSLLREGGRRFASNLVRVPAPRLASTAFNTHPLPLQVAGTRQAHVTHHHGLSDAAVLGLGRFVRALLGGADAADMQSRIAAWVAGHRVFRFQSYPGRASAYVVDTVQTVLHCFSSHADFEAAVVAAVNRGEDAASREASGSGQCSGPWCGMRSISRLPTS